MKFRFKKYIANKYEMKLFHKKLGYNLKKPIFCQDLQKTKQFYYHRLRKLFYLNHKMQAISRNLLKRKVIHWKNRYNILNFFRWFTESLREIKSYDRQTIQEKLDSKFKFFYYDKYRTQTRLLLKKLMRNFFNNYKNYYKNFNLKKKRKLKYNKRKIYSLILKNTNNNFFFILTTLKGKVVWYCSSGQVCEFYNIKRKRSHLLIKQMMQKFSRKLRSLKIKYLKVFIRSHISKHIRKVIIFLDNRNIRIKYIIFNKPLPHHFGQRKKKLRRI